MISHYLEKMFNKKVYSTHEFCPRCEANLTLQKGYDNELLYWICKGCGEMLINPAVDTESDIVWLCDRCDAMLNIQPGFSERLGEWCCDKCGFINEISASEIYSSEDDYRDSLVNPYKGMEPSKVIELMKYDEVCRVDGYDDIYIVRNSDEGKLYIKKERSTYDKSIYQFFADNHVTNVPNIYHMYEANGYLVLIEEYIDGVTLEEALKDGPLAMERAVEIILSIARILKQMHEASPSIIHRDIKPSNIMIAEDGEVYLIDVNVAKWYKEGEAEDTRLLGTRDYAAPEQFGCGVNASSVKTDIYGLGVLLNVLITGKLPKEKMATDKLAENGESGGIEEIIRRCISLEVARRYSDDELIDVLTNYRANMMKFAP